MDNNLSMIIGGRLLNLSTISRDTGISRTTLASIYYKRSKTVKLDTLTKLCDYLQVPLHELIDYQPKEG
ncbi:helix-turn-helix transcriptional regulator [Latilactobacillus sakei]|uniref:helix-turn-helix domain-containing protein n=1 Tax=Latilactobacillus sakei TaxID=1599 RepID=UPI0020C7BC43|nr:helix-turn-helix transcriptional regulator [Latilactobacillus sakei]MCP8854697.1 helix-turn-helix transcriptional regulator [Latilactobacillus sakei]